MSFIRPKEERKYSKGANSLYVFPTDVNQGKDFEEYYIEFCGDKPLRNNFLAVPAEDFCEVMFRIFEQVGIYFEEETINSVRKRMCLEKLKNVTTKN